MDVLKITISFHFAINNIICQVLMRDFVNIHNNMHTINYEIENLANCKTNLLYKSRNNSHFMQIGLL